MDVRAVEAVRGREDLKGGFAVGGVAGAAGGESIACGVKGRVTGWVFADGEGRDVEEVYGCEERWGWWWWWKRRCEE